jgi:hypothetical protein
MEITMRSEFMYKCFFYTLLVLALIGCGGSPNGPGGPPSFTPANIQGQWQILAKSNLSSTNVLLVETNFTQTGTSVFAGNPSVILIQGTQGGTGITLTGLGGACDNGVVGNDSVQGTFSSQTQLSFTFTEAGTLGIGSTTGNATSSSDGSQISSGTYSTPAACGFAGDNGTVTGFKIKPFSGAYAGMLTNSGGSTDAVIVTVTQTNLDLNVSGTDNGTSFMLSGTAIGATFDVSGTIAGQAVQYVGVYDSTANDFLVFEPSLTFLGTLKAGTNPQAVAMARGFLSGTK